MTDSIGKIILMLFLSTFLLSGNAFGRIVVDGSAEIWEKDLSYPAALVEVSQKVGPRILVEYATSLYETGMEISDDLISVSGGVEPRIVLEYATSLFESPMVYPDEFVTLSERVAPRIVVNSATSVWVENLIHPFAVEEFIAGDLDGVDGVTLADAILVLKILTGHPLSMEIGATIGNDEKCTLADSIFVLQKVAEIR
jgi:hypothetical protein